MNPKALFAVAVLTLGMGGGTEALAAPVFTGAGLSVDAMSPNGDNVQDFTVIDYTVQSDSADVRVQLTPLGGGPVVGVLQPFARRAMGLHTLVFDGTLGGNPVADGNYQVEVLGIGTQGEGSEQRNLPLVVDRVAPAITSWDRISATSTLQNGDTVVLQACADADADTVLVDLSALDSGFDPAMATEVPVSPDCRQFTYAVTAGNTLPDLQGPVAVATAVDAAGNSTVATLDLCLSNSPPVITGVTLLNSSPFFQNGDEIQVEITVSSPNAITATGDFSNLDSGFNPGGVVFTDLGNQKYEVAYRVTQNNNRSDGDYTLQLSVMDQGCGTAVDNTLIITLDNAGANSSLLDNIFLSAPAFSPRGNGNKTVTINFTALEDSLLIGATVTADLAATMTNPESRQTITIRSVTLAPNGPQAIVWNGNGLSANQTADRLKDQQVTIVLRAVSVALDRQRTINIPLEIDSTPPVLELFPEPSSVKARNNQLVKIPVTYDRPGYSIVADFSSLDSNFNPLTSTYSTPDSGDGRYGIFYSVSGTNTVPDTTDIPVPLTAVDAAGNFAQSDLVRVCLNNLPPAFVSSRFLGSAGPFKNGQLITLETVWSTEANQGPLVVTADFSAVDVNFSSVNRPATVLNRGNNVFEISYTVSTGNTIEEGTLLPVYVTARDNPDLGCGATTVEAVHVNLDSRSGPQPTLTAAAQVTKNAFVGLSGRALQAIQVQIQRSNVAVDTFTVNADSTYSGQISLETGSNIFTARGIDAAGNISPPSRPVEIFRSGGTILEIPARFAPGDEFFLALLQSADRITVRVFNLEGTELKRLESGSGALVRIPWDGRDNTGNLASSGPYLAVVEVEAGGGIRERLRKAFVFTRRGIEQ